MVVGFMKRLAERHGRELERETAGLQNAALHFLRTLPQMCMAGIEIAPSIDDRDHRLAANIVELIPTCLARERWPKERRSLTPNQRWLRNSSGVLRVMRRPAPCGYSDAAERPALILSEIGSSGSGRASIGKSSALSCRTMPRSASLYWSTRSGRCSILPR